MSSFTVFTGSDGCTTRTLGTSARIVTGAKSRTVSKGTFAYTAGLLVSVLPGDASSV
jgi:hypothetical protein